MSETHPKLAEKPRWDSTHEAACHAGKDTYIDPDTGFSVFTRVKLLKNEECCGSGCRHCPYLPKAKAGNRSKA